MIETFELLIKKYGVIAVAGLFGAIVKRFRKEMTFVRFVATIGVSIFISIITGIFCKEWTNLSEPAIFGACGIAGVFSDEILDEIQEMIQEISAFVKTFINSKIGNNGGDKDN